VELPPHGSRIRLTSHSEGLGNIEVPPPKVDFMHMSLMIGFIGLAYMLTSITVELAGDEPSLVLPFILISLIPAFICFGGLFNALLGRQKILLTKDSVEIRKIRPFFRRTYVIPYSKIEKIDVERGVPKTLLEGFETFYLYLKISGRMKGEDFRKEISLPTIHHENERTRFAEHVTDDEKAWLVEVIRTAMQGVA